MAAALIGRARCPVCGSERARLTASGKGLAVLTCNACNLQTFARSDNSDTRLRALLLERASDSTPPADPAPGPAPLPAPPALPPAPVAPRAAWGFLQS